MGGAPQLADETGAGWRREGRRGGEGGKTAALRPNKGKFATRRPLGGDTRRLTELSGIISAVGGALPRCTPPPPSHPWRPSGARGDSEGGGRVPSPLAAQRELRSDDAPPPGPPARFPLDSADVNPPALAPSVQWNFLAEFRARGGAGPAGSARCDWPAAVAHAAKREGSRNNRKKAAGRPEGRG